MSRQHLRGLLRQTDEVFAIGDFCSRRLNPAVVEKKQVDVRAVIEFAAAQLAQRQNSEARIDHASFGIDSLRSSEAMLQLGLRLAQRFLDEHIGQRRNLRCRLSQSRDGQHIAQHDADVLAPLEARQQRRRIGLERSRAHAREIFLELLTGVRAIQIAARA